MSTNINDVEKLFNVRNNVLAWLLMTIGRTIWNYCENYAQHLKNNYGQTFLWYLVVLRSKVQKCIHG